MSVPSNGQRADVNKFVGPVLVSGVVLSLVVLVWGSILYLLHPTAPRAGTGFVDIVSGTARLNPWATINLGLLVLLATPVTRIVAAAIAFAIDRQYKFVLISLTILIVLSLSITYGTLRHKEKMKELHSKPANTLSLRTLQRNR